MGSKRFFAVLGILLAVAMGVVPVGAVGSGLGSSEGGVNSWSIAVLTDLHIGYGIGDYGGAGYDDNGTVVEGAAAGYAQAAVEEINKVADSQKIAFVAVLGDLTDSAEASELRAARLVLDNLTVPWLPIMGNHDTWPMTESVVAPATIIPESYFDEIMGPVYSGLGEEMSGWGKESPALVYDPEVGRYTYFENYYFDCRGFHFVCLDFNDRGGYARGNLNDFAGGTWTWFREHMAEYVQENPEGGSDVILLAHHPMTTDASGLGRTFTSAQLEEISDWANNTYYTYIDSLGGIQTRSYGSRVWGQLAGHLHPWNQVVEYPSWLNGGPVVEYCRNFGEVRIGLVNFTSDTSAGIDYSSPMVATEAAGSISTSSATMNGYLASRGGSSSVQVSFEYGLTTSYGQETTPQSPWMTSPGSFSYSQTGFSSDTTYHFRAKAVGGGLTTYGSDMTFTTASGPACPQASVNQKILILVHGGASASTELSLIKGPLDAWGYTVEVFDHTEYYDLLGSGDHYYLHDVGGGHGDLDLVVQGDMEYKVIIFDAADGTAYADVETSARTVKQMFQEYPFVGVVRKESAYTWKGSTNNVFQVGISGSAAKDLTMANPTGGWALEPLKGYKRSFTSWGAVNVSAKTSNVAVLESFDDGTPAITEAAYSSGGRAMYFAFKDWGIAPSVSMLVRLIQEYSDIPYKLPYYSLEIDDAGQPVVNGESITNEDYEALMNWAKSNLGGYPTLGFIEEYLDSNPPADILVWGQPPQYAQNTSFYAPNAELMAELKAYNDYVVAAHGYQHDMDWWKSSTTGTPVDPLGDQDGDGIVNWQDLDIDGDGIANTGDSDLALYTDGAFLTGDLAMQELWFQRMREVLDLYGYSDASVFIAPKFDYLDGATNGLASEYGFDVISAKSSTPGFTMTQGWVNGTYAPGRVAPTSVGTDPDVALTSAEDSTFTAWFMGYIGGYPLCLVTNHVWQFAQGGTAGYELRDSYLGAYGVMNTAGFRLVSTQTATDKSVGWLWTDMSSVQDSSGDITLTLDSSAFADGKAKHELDIVMPFSIKAAKVGGNYCIYVDDQTLFYGKGSNSTESIQVLSGTYDSTLPRVTSVSTPATDVLNAIYNPADHKILLVLDGTLLTSVGISGSNRPFSDGTTSIGSGGNSVLSVSLAGELSTQSVDMSVLPSSDSVDIAILNWGNLDTSYREWTESSAVSGTRTIHTMGGLVAGEYYSIWYTKGGGERTLLQTVEADGSGRINFTYEEGYSGAVVLRVVMATNRAPVQPSNLTPVNGATGVSLTPTLQASPFADPDAGDSHLATQWQITATAGDYASPVFDSGADERGWNLTSAAIPALTLDSATTYYWHVRYEDNRGAWSDWSAETFFTTTPRVSNDLTSNLTVFSQDYTAMSRVPDNIALTSDIVPCVTENEMLSYNSTGHCVSLDVSEGASGKLLVGGLAPALSTTLTLDIGMGRTEDHAIVNVFAGGAWLALRLRNNEPTESLRIESYYYNPTLLSAVSETSNVGYGGGGRFKITIASNSVTKANTIYLNGVQKLTTPFTAYRPNSVVMAYDAFTNPFIYVTMDSIAAGQTAYLQLYSIEQTVPQYSYVTPISNPKLTAFGLDGPHAWDTVDSGLSLLGQAGARGTIWADVGDVANLSQEQLDALKALIAGGWELGIHFNQRLSDLPLADATALMDTQTAAITATFGESPTSFCSLQNADNVTHAEYAYTHFGMVWRNGWNGVGSGLSNIGNLDDEVWGFWSSASAAGIVIPSFSHELDITPAIPFSISGDHFESFLSNHASHGIQIVGFREYWETAENSYHTTVSDVLCYPGVSLSFKIANSGGKSRLFISAPWANAVRDSLGNSVPYEVSGSGIIIEVGAGSYTVAAAAPQADFLADRTAVVVDQPIQFTDLSSGGVAPLIWEWDFNNDGVVDSNLQNPTYSYGATGTYTVVLKVTDAVTTSSTQTKTSYITVSPAPPSISSTNPASATQGQSLSVAIAGTYLTGATAVSFGSGIAVSGYTVDSATQITASIVVGGSVAIGSRDVQVTTPGGVAALTGGFAVAQAPPALASLSPTRGAQGSTVSVTIRGTYLAGVSAVSFGSGILVNSYTISNSTRMTASITIDGSADVGSRDVLVTTVGGTAGLIGGFNVTQGRPTVTSVTPASGYRGYSLSVAITGVYFIGVTSVSFGSGVIVNSLIVDSATQITANITIGSSATVGTRTVSVTTTAGTGRKSAGFAVYTPPVPTISTVSPTSGLRGQAMSVSIAGTNFIATRWVSFGSGITVNSFTVGSATQITASITIGSYASTGTRSVLVTTPGGTATMSGGFVVNLPPAPTISTVSPNSGSRGQTLSVTITGTNLIGARTVSFGSGITVNSFTVDSATQITAYITVGMLAIGGTRTVSVTAPGGTVTKSSGFGVT